MSVILKAENISKQYRLGLVGTGTLGDDLKRWWYQVRGKEDPFLKVGAVNSREAKATEDYVWALRDINFEVKQGEVLGIIGKNGAGKSTLLKLLSRVTAPTTGSIKTKGRIASLLEVGTGFHGELTGRENIFMNGAILGMIKAEIKRKLDEIIAFSGCEMYIDTPVKRYSSGMTVRLGFAVAAHLEPEILVVDEVLAVGDAEFQKKAIGKMQDLSTGEGRTVLFVSHNMGSVRALCDKIIVLKNGCLDFIGETNEGIHHYFQDGKLEDNLEFIEEQPKDLPLRIENILIKKELDDGLGITMAETFSIYFGLMNNDENNRCDITLKFNDEYDRKFMVCSTGSGFEQKWTDKKGKLQIKFTIPANLLNEGTYYIDVLLVINRRKAFYIKERAFSFDVLPKAKKLGQWAGKADAPIVTPLNWEVFDNR